MSTPVVERTSLTERVSKRIRHAMIDKDWNQADLARALGTQEAWVSRRLNGRVVWNIEELGLVAGALGVAPANLFPETSPVRSGPPTDRYTPAPKRPMIPHPRVSRPPFGGAVRTRPLSDIDQMTEPNRVVPADVWADRAAVADFDPAPPAW